MITSTQALKKFGNPKNEKNMVLLELNYLITKEIPCLPKKIYCNAAIKAPLLKAFNNIIERRLQSEMKTWDGCFNIRAKKGGTLPSLHSWGLAIDINAAENGFNEKPKMSKKLVACFTDAGFEWGGDWSTPDGMHFQLSKF